MNAQPQDTDNDNHADEGIQKHSEHIEAGHWISLDMNRGKLVCKALNAEYDGFYCVIVDARLIRIMKDRQGAMLCESNDRFTADKGRPGRVCQTCPDRDRACLQRWRLTWMDDETGIVFHHTISTMASFNFQRFATDLCHRGLHPSQVLTSITVEQATRQRSGTSYYRLQFERIRVFDTPCT